MVKKKESSHEKDDGEGKNNTQVYNKTRVCQQFIPRRKGLVCLYLRIKTILN